MTEQPKKRMSHNYIDNKKFQEAMTVFIRECRVEAAAGRQRPKIPDYIGKCIYDIATNLAKKYNFANYSYIDEMVSDGIENCFHGSTEILTQEYGSVDMKSCEGKTITVKCSDGEWRQASVQHFGRQKLYEIGFGRKGKSSMQKVLVTANHRWFVESRLNNRGLTVPQQTIIIDLSVGDVLQNAASSLTTMDKDAVIHGILFGDGSGHKDVVYSEQKIVRQGDKYCRIRVCKQDSVREEIEKIFMDAGYSYTRPKSANGDAVFYIGKYPYVKDVPFTYDPDYIAGFIYGWWLADGTKSRLSDKNRFHITTSNDFAAKWLMSHAQYAGFHVISHIVKERSETDGSYVNGKPLHQITLAHSSLYNPRVNYIEEVGIDDVYCVVEPETNSFVLANGLLTGNCITYIDRFDPDNPKANAFSYFTQTMWFAFLRRIDKEKKQGYIKDKYLANLVMMDQGEAADSDFFLGSQKTLEEYHVYENIAAFEEGKEKKNKRRKAKPAKE